MESLLHGDSNSRAKTSVGSVTSENYFFYGLCFLLVGNLITSQSLKCCLPIPTLKYPVESGIKQQGQKNGGSEDKEGRDLGASFTGKVPPM